MYQKSEGILINSLRYTDSSYIVTIYSKKFGRQTYILKGVQKQKTKIKANYLQPLFLLDFECTYKETNNINKIFEISLNKQFQTISLEPIKNTIAFFIADILDNTLREAEENIEMYNFLKKQIIVLDSIDTNISLFSLFFMVNYTRFLGITPDIESMTKEHYFNSQQIESFTILLNNNFSDLLNYKIKRENRQAFLEKLMLYYQIRFEINKFKSYEILKELFS